MSKEVVVEYTSKGLPIVSIIGGVTSFLKMGGSASIGAKVIGALGMGIVTPFILVGGAIGGVLAGGILGSIAGAILGVPFGKDKIAPMAEIVAGSGAMLGVFAAPLLLWGDAQDYVENLINKNHTATENQNAFHESATPFVRELNEINKQLVAEKGLKLEMPKKAPSLKVA